MSKTNAISIQNILQAENMQRIESHINTFLKNAKGKRVSVILPTAFMAEQFISRFKSNIESVSTINIYCFHRFTLDYLKSNENAKEQQNYLSNVEYINKDNTNPLENFIQNVRKEARIQRERKLNKRENNPVAFFSPTISVGSGNTGGLDNIRSVKINQDRIRHYSLFEDIEELDYTNLDIPDKENLNFSDKSNKDSIGIQLIKDFFIELIGLVNGHFKSYLKGKEIQKKKLLDIKTRLWKARNEILENLNKANRQKGDDETRAALLIALKVGIVLLTVCLALGSGGIFALLALSVGSIAIVREIPEIVGELQTIKDNRYYRAIAVPILNALFGDVAYAIALCMIEFRNFILLDSEGNFLDLSGIDIDRFFAFKEEAFKFTPICNQMIKGKYNGTMQDIIDALKHNGSMQIDNNDFSYMCISPLKLNTNNQSPSYKLFDTLQSSYTNLVCITHPIFSSTILANTIKSKNTTSRDSKNYIIMTPPPNKTKSGSTESMMSELGTRIEGRPKPPESLHKDTQDYSAYIHNEDTEYNELFLQITPFVKVNQERKGQYKDLLSQGDMDYIQQFMIQAQDIKYIKEMQGNIIKDHISYYKKLFDSVRHKEKIVDYDMVFGGINYIYTLENILLKAFILYYLEQDGVSITQGFWTKEVYAKIQDIETELYSRKTRFYAMYNKSLIPVDILDLKEQIKKAVTAYQENEKNDCKIVLGWFLNKITLMPFSDNTQNISFAFATNEIKQYIAIDDENIDKALPPIIQTVAQNILTNIIPSTKIFFADTESKKLEALSIIFVTFSFAFVYAIVKNKNLVQTSLAMLTGISSFAKMSEIIKNATLEALEVAFDNRMNNIQLSKNIKKNKQIIKLLKQVNVKNPATHILDRAGNKLLVLKEGDSIRLSVSYCDNAKSVKCIIIQPDTAHKKTTVRKQLATDSTKAIGSVIVITLIDTILTEIINSSFNTNSKELLEQYKHLELKTKQLYNAPLVVDRDTFFTYPMPIDSRMIVYNMGYGLFGGSLQNGGLEVYPSIMLYAALQSVIKNSGNIANQARYTKAMIVNQILAFIIPDELREGMQDEAFYNRMLQKTFLADSLKKQYRIDKYNKVLQRHNAYENIRTTYKLSEKQINKQHIQSNGNAYIIIDSYNICIDYLADILDNKPKTTNTRQFVESLRNIAKNNILAIYDGIQENNKVGQPKIFGRIATTIILENGLHLG